MRVRGGPAGAVEYCRRIACLVIVFVCPAQADSADDLAALGRQLFFDASLSLPRTQSCATCHEPAHAFSDGRDNAVARAASHGADGVALGDRNAPSLTYAATVPRFERASDGEFRGGLFHDGRATDLATQAREPFTNALEMALPDLAGVAARLRAGGRYDSAFAAQFGASILHHDEALVMAATQAIAAFERGPPFLAFDSRYDRFLRGEETLTASEERGRRLYFSDLTNCMSCHLLHSGTAAAREPFTDFRYHNIGIPLNPALRAANHLGQDYRDHGLARHPEVDEPAAAGRFRTPSLRNVAVTAPYMHNGLFARLETAIQFYNQYIVSNATAGINPETAAPWGAPETTQNLALDLLRGGQPLDSARIADLVAFLRTLTDRRYEHLLDPLPTPPMQEPSHE